MLQLQVNDYEVKEFFADLQPHEYSVHVFRVIRHIYESVSFQGPQYLPCQTDLVVVGETGAPSVEDFRGNEAGFLRWVLRD